MGYNVLPLLGKTQTINHFLIRTTSTKVRPFYLVDLPGYGYAKAPGSARISWLSFTKEFFINRKQLMMVFVLVDSSIPPSENDIACIDWLEEFNVPCTIVFTKADKKVKSDALRREESVSSEREGEDQSTTKPIQMIDKRKNNIKSFYSLLLVSKSSR